ncbi:hypothetical protein MIR68_007172 [Amoeboaphelidium protococcarum]|nr:hypothetical protein MIR68_007172 [Amoeboaphelidium protococcarum]
MVNWGKRPEFNPGNTLPRWRTRLDTAMVFTGAILVGINVLYVTLGIYTGQLDVEEYRKQQLEKITGLDKKIYSYINSKISGGGGQVNNRPSQHADNTQFNSTVETQKPSIIELAAQIRQKQKALDQREGQTKQ